MVQTTADVDPTTAPRGGIVCGKHVAERPRRRIRATVLVTACVLAVEFAFLTWLYHFDDGAQERSEATARASVALAGWHPGEDPAPVARELEALAGSGVADADQLRTLTSHGPRAAARRTPRRSRRPPRPPTGPPPPSCARPTARSR